MNEKCSSKCLKNGGFVNLDEIGYLDFFHQEYKDEAIGRISFVGRTEYKVMVKRGEYHGVLKGTLMYRMEESRYPTIGDWVEVKELDDEKVLITKVYDRMNSISRKVSGIKTKEQLLAANIDNVLICLSLNENYNINRLERYLFALTTGVNPVVVLTKKDLSDDYERYRHEVKTQYPNLDVRCVSAYHQDFDGLDTYFRKGKTAVLIGSSGVGKSTLVNTLFGKELMETNEISVKHDKGKHTTTFRQLIVLGAQRGCIIDTPGMRELSVWNGDEGDSSFSDIIELSKGCKFRNCQHRNESDCALTNAVKEGSLSEDRYKNYMKLKAEYEYINRQKNFITKKEHNKKIKERVNKKKRSY